jgi:hypothetical protein
MPLWVLLGGAAAIVLYLVGKGVAAPVPGALKYQINVASSYFSTDPSSGQGATSAGTLQQGTIVYSTAAAPVMSADQSFELVSSPSGNVWVPVSNLTHTT